MKKEFYINEKTNDLISNLIYDIQNYNITISSYIKNIEKLIEEKLDNKDIKESKEYINSIIRQSFLIEKTVKSFNEFSNINSSGLVLNKILDNINDIINDVINDFKPLLLSKKIKILKEQDDEILSLIDKIKIKNAISNIFVFIFNYLKVNSILDIKYSIINYSEEEFIFSVGSERSNLINKYVSISISFLSNNIPEELRKKLLKKAIIYCNDINFNNLYLYSSYNIIKKHLGDMWIDKVGSKNRITVLLPIEK